MLRFQIRVYQELDNIEVCTHYELVNKEVAQYAGEIHSKHGATVVIDDTMALTTMIYRKGKRVE